MKVTAIILAAGKGSRMNSKISKQYMQLCEKPVLYYSISAFADSDVDEIIIVTAAKDIKYCKEEITEKYFSSTPLKIVEGGNERYESVYNALKTIKADYVLIHDGARPHITKQIINKCIEEVKKTGACITAVPVKDTIKKVKDNTIEDTPDRKQLWQAQTPQCFMYDLIKTGYDKAMEKNDKSITDDAMVVEKYTNTKIKIVEGTYYNFKITTQEDFEFSETIISKRDK